VNVQATPKQPPAKRLNVVEVAAGTLAAVSSAVAASALGVEGTLTGAAVGSVVATLATALYAKSLTGTRDRLKDLRPRRSARPPRGPDATRSLGRSATTVAGSDTAVAAGAAARLSGTVYGRRKRRWPVVAATAAAAVAAFGLAIALITGVELALGQPLANLYGQHTGGGTSIGTVSQPASSRNDIPVPASDQPSDEPSGTPASADPTESPSGRSATPSPAASSPTTGGAPSSAAVTPTPIPGSTGRPVP
jgi:hypothetical protein